MQDLIAKFDFCGGLCAAVVLFLAVRWAEHYLPRFAKAMWWAAGGAFLGVAAWATLVMWPPKGQQVVCILLAGMIAACATGLAAAFFVSPIADAFGAMIRAIMNSRRQRKQDCERKRRWTEDELKHRRQVEIEEARSNARMEAWKTAHARPPAPKPVPLTKEEKAEVAKQHYERTLRLLKAANLDDVEREAAERYAKQRYMRELHETML